MILNKGFHSRYRRFIIRSCTAALLILPTLPGPAEPAEVKHRFTLGYDSFIDRFTILEDDTVEAVHEFHAGLGNSIAFERGKTKSSLRNLFRYGNQTVDDNLDGELSLSHWKSTRISLRGNVRWKHFNKGSDYTFGNDYIQSNTFLKIRRLISESISLGWKSRFEATDYDEKTDFDYDYRYIDGGMEFTAGSYFEKMIRFGAAVGFKEAPDTTALSYRRSIVDLELQLAGSSGTMFNLTVSTDRRDYRESIRSSYWMIFSLIDLTFNETNGRTYSIKAESELTMYDDPTTIYFDTHFLRAGLRAKYPVRGHTSIYAEPRFAGMFSSDFEEEEYMEGSMMLGIDYFGANGIWISASYEPGYRDYVIAGNELYSDFFFNRLSLMGSFSMPRELSLNLYVSHDPERHERRDDDFSITLISVSLTKQF